MSFDRSGDTVANGARHCTEEAGRALGRIFVHIRMSGRDERDAETPCDPRTELSDIIRPGDVDQIWAERPHRPYDPTEVTPEEEIAAQVSFERNRDAAARQLQLIAVLGDRNAPRPVGMHTQKGVAPPARERMERLTRLRHAVYFVVTVRHERDAWRSVHH
jgi:hypothetical protein